MKRYKNLWDTFVSPENLDLAAYKALRGKKKKNCAKKFLANRAENLEILRQSLINNTFTTGNYKKFVVYEPKRRDIYMLPLYPDHIVHHALMNVLGPLWQKLFIHDSFACIPGRGLHAASHRCAMFVKHNRYVLQCDVRKFYPSINHDVMMNIILRKIADKRILALLDNIVRSVPGGVGIPIGNLTSQWLGNVYLNDLDMFVKHHLRARNYIRYCDDFCIFSDNRDVLMRYKHVLESFLGEKLKLKLSRAFIKPTSHGVNFIGYKHFPNNIILSHSGGIKIRRRMGEIIRHGIMSKHVFGQICAYSGWIRWARTFHMRLNFYSWARLGGDDNLMTYLSKYML